MSQGVIEHKYTAFSLFPSLCYYRHGLEDDIFLIPQKHFLKLMRSYCIEYRRDSLPLRGKKYKRRKNTSHNRIHSFSAEKDDNLIIVLNTCLGYVKRHKLVWSHLKSRSIVLPLTKPIWSCIFDKIPTSPCLLAIIFFSWIRVFSIVCCRQKTTAHVQQASYITQTILGKRLTKGCCIPT